MRAPTIPLTASAPIISTMNVPTAQGKRHPEPRREAVDEPQHAEPYAPGDAPREEDQRQPGCQSPVDVELLAGEQFERGGGIEWFIVGARRAGGRRVVGKCVRVGHDAPFATRKGTARAGRVRKRFTAKWAMMTGSRRPVCGR